MSQSDATSTPPSDVRVTVVSPCYDDGKFIVETADSIAETESVELIIVDDGSPDPYTQQVLADLAKRERVRVVRHEVNRGVSAGLTTGLREATTPYVFFIGADDLIAPGALGALADALDADPNAVAAWGHYEFFGARTGKRTTPPWDPWRVIHNNYWTGVAMVRRQAILDLGGFSERSKYEDWDMWMSVAQAGKHGLVVDVPMFRYRIHPTTDVRRCATAKDAFPAEYAAMRDGHQKLFAQRQELAATSSLSFVGRCKERLMLALKLRLPKVIRRAIYGTAAWLETRRETRTHA